MSAPRRLTQRVSRHVYESVAGDGEPFSGISYESRLGDDVVCIGLFEAPDRWLLSNASSEPVHVEDADFSRALELLAVNRRPFRPQR